MQSSRSDLRERLIAGIPVTERRLDLAGIDTAVLEGGGGPPLVLLHGPGEFAEKWIRVLPELVTSHRVIAPDLPGHGASRVAGGPLGADRALAWLDELVERTCSSPPVLVGHLLGGAVAARFAARHADRVGDLVLVDSLGLARFRPSPGFAFALVRYQARPSERSFDALMQRCTFDFDRVRDDLGDRWPLLQAYTLELGRDPDVKSAVQSLMRDLALKPIPPSELAAIEAPTTLIWGRHDLAVRPRVAEMLSARHGWPLHMIEDSADDPPFEQPLAFLDALSRSIRPVAEVAA